MKTLRSRTTGFSERPVYELHEIENTCVDALASVQELPEKPSPVRIDRFIEKYFQIDPEYLNLGGKILGCTEFGKKGVTRIIISKELEEQNDQVSKRRARSTLAHEAGHGLLHTSFIVAGSNGDTLFTEMTDPEKPRILCKDIPGASSASQLYDGRWWEWQANRAMSCLLLPKRLLETDIAPFMISRGSLGGKIIDREKVENAVRKVSADFDINPIVARLRINDLYPVKEDAQGWL